MSRHSEISEEKTAGSSYILTFYREIMNLSHQYANYINLIVVIKEKNKSGLELDNLEELDKQQLVDQVQTVRYYVNKCFLMYRTIVQEGLKNELDKNIIEIHKRIMNSFVIGVEDLEIFVVKINGILVNKVMKNLLESSQEFVDNLYSENE